MVSYLSLGPGRLRAAFLLPEIRTTTEVTVKNRLAYPLPLERTWCPCEDAMLAALRVVIGLPARPVRSRSEVTI